MEDTKKQEAANLPNMLDDLAAHDHRHTADTLDALRERIGKDNLSMDEWNALIGATSHHRIEAARRERHLPQPYPLTQPRAVTDTKVREALEIAASMVDTPIARRRLGIDGNDERLVEIRSVLAKTETED